MAEQKYDPDYTYLGTVGVEVTQRYVWITQNFKKTKYPKEVFKGKTKEQILRILDCDKWSAALLEDHFKLWIPHTKTHIKIYNAYGTKETTVLADTITLKDGTIVPNKPDEKFLFETLTDEQYNEYAEILMSRETSK